MKRIVLTGFAVLLMFALAACDFGVKLTGGTEEGEEFVQYSSDGKSITINLEGGAPSRNMSRALTNALAQINHDYYEVVFFYNATASATVTTASQVARTSWSRGEGAALSVFRGNNSATGIDYGSVNYSLSAVSGTPGTLPDTGAAILFVGKKESGRYVLLAVGKLNGTTNNNGTSGAATVVTSQTSKVTFDIVTLASAIKPTIPIAAGTSSFFTIPDSSYGNYLFDSTGVSAIDATSTAANPGGGTNFIPQPYNAVDFPLFMLASNQGLSCPGIAGDCEETCCGGAPSAGVPDCSACTVTNRHYAAKFSFTTATGSGPATGLHTIDNYVNGIVAAVPDNHKYTEVIPPGFIVGGDKSKSNTDIEGVKVEMKNNNTTAEQLLKIKEEAYFIITVPGDIGGMIAFTFNIPVFAITNRISNNSVNAIQWLIQPGLESLFVDNGVGLGGSILFGIGDPSKLALITNFLE